MIILGYIWILFLGGLLALILQLRADARGDAMKIPAWNASWLDIGLYIWLLVFLVIACQSAVGQLLGYFLPGDESLPSWSLAQGMAFHLTTLTLMWVLYQRSDLRENLPLSAETIGPAGLIAACAGFFFSGILLALLVGKLWEMTLGTLRHLGLAGETPPQELVSVFIAGGISPVIILLIVLAVVIAPVTEELLFRAGIYRFLKGRFSARFALVVSSLLFAMMHFNTLSFLPLFLLGMLLCRSYERTGNILVPIGFHALFNANNIGLLILQGSHGLTEELVGTAAYLP